AECMAVPALLVLKDQTALHFEGRSPVQELPRQGRSAPGSHGGRPGWSAAQPGEGCESSGKEDNEEYGDRSPLPALLAGAGDKRQEEQNGDCSNRGYQNERRFELGGQECQGGVEPQEENIRLGNRVDQRRIGSLRRSKRAEHRGAYQHREDDQAAEQKIPLERIRYERHSVLMHLTLVPGQVGLAADQPPGHRPLVDTELEY